MVCSRYPRECRYYETTLKRKCFRKLKNNVWENKIKWKLEEKADSHYRLKTLDRYFNSWLLFLKESLKERINTRLADSFYYEKLKSRGILALKRNAEKNCTLIHAYTKMFEWNLKFKVWHFWRHYTLKRLKVNEIKLLADKIRDEKLMVTSLHMWSFRFKEKCIFKEAFEKAVEHHDTRLKRKFWNSWKIYKNRKIFMKEILRLSVVYREDKLKERIFRFWKEYICRRKIKRKLLAVTRSFYENYLSKKYLNKWFVFHEKFMNEREVYLYSLAKNFHDKKVLEKSFTSWRRVREVEKSRKEKMLKFQDRQTIIYLSYYIKLWETKKFQKDRWNQMEIKAAEWWSHKLTERFLATLTDRYRERMEHREQMESVSKYWEAIIIHRAFNGWKEVKDKKCNRRIQCEKAMQFYSDKLTTKIFKKWKEYKCLASKKKMAIAYYKDILLFRCMDRWKIFLDNRKKILIRVTKLEEKHNLKLLNNAFSIWKNDLILIKNEMDLAVNFYKKTKMSKVFVLWKKKVQKRAVNKFRYNRNSNILNSSIIKSSIQIWYDMLLIKQNLKKKILALKVQQDERLIRVHFSAWFRFVEKIKNIDQAVDVFPQLSSMILIEAHLNYLKESLSFRRILKKKEDLAVRAEKTLLKRNYLRKWVAFVCWKKEKLLQRRITDDLLENDSEKFDSFVSIPKNSRRKPLIPGYLKTEFNFDEFEVSDTMSSFRNEKTFRVTRPFNKRLPVVGHQGMFVSFET